MFFEISKEIVIKCDKCGKVNIIDKNDFDVNTFSSERQMGTEVTHEFSAESNCSECNNDFNCIVRVYEYPIGALNYTDNDCDGGIFIVAPQIETYYEEEIIEEKLEEKQMIEKLVELSDNRFKKSKCWLCSYRKHCPHDCGRCLHYIHTPDKAPAPRKYDCGRMCDYYVCKYSHKYMSELYYALRGLKDLKNINNLKVLSIGCGPCTDILALDYLKKHGLYNYNSIEYRGVEIDTNIWKRIYADIKEIAPDTYDINIINADACSYVDQLLEQEWKPNLIVFQYVFSDMQKHSQEEKIMHLLETIGKYVSQCENGLYIVCNDINLSRQFNGGREFFDMLLNKISCKTQYIQFHFNNTNKSGHFNYGQEHKSNNLVCPIPDKILSYEPFTSCASAQMIIKKVISNDN